MQNNSQDISTNPLVQQLCEASSTGDLEQVKRTIAQVESSEDGSLPNLYYLLKPMLKIAASNNQAAIVSYLLDQGLECDKVTVKAAVSAGSIDVLQAFLDYDWDINKSLGLGGGPALASRLVLFSPF